MIFAMYAITLLLFSGPDFDRSVCTQEGMLPYACELSGAGVAAPARAEFIKLPMEDLPVYMEL
jgi:hypothetical protein